VIPNYLPETYRTVERHTELHDPPQLMWSGTVATHPTDLQVADPLGPAIRSGELSFRLLGHITKVPEYLGIREEDVELAPWADLADYPQEMSRGDVGLVPLDDIPFNQCKSWLKGVEFAGAGVPFIASRTEPYRMLRDEHGLGELAKKPGDWPRLARKLVADPAAWRDESQRYRETALDRLMILDHWAEWEEAWLRARENWELKHG
jgi:hypothetical protein